MSDTRAKKKRKAEDVELPIEKLPIEKLPFENINGSTIIPSARVCCAGKISRVFVRNFMCHDALEIVLNPNVNFIIGRNGSGKSAILTALTVGLGARAQITNRGGSVKEFVKKGKVSATIEVTIMNEGVTAFKPEEYGKTVTVVRRIGQVSKYELKNASGRTISTKKDELDHMLSIMNIQVENPVSVLNQDVSRSFLTTASSSDKYSLFVKATQIDVASKRYKEALLDSEDARRRLENAKSELAEVKKELEALEHRLKMLQSVDACQEEVERQELELCWATAIEEEGKLRRIEETKVSQQKSLEDIEAVEGMREAKEAEIDSKIEKLKENIREIESAEGSTDYEVAKERYQTAKDSYAEKKREWLAAQTKVKRTENDMALIQQEIKRLESAQDGGNERALRKEEAVTKKQELDEIEAMLRTKHNEQMHFSTEKMRFEQEERNMKVEVQRHEGEIRKTKQKLLSLKQQSDNASTIFGSDMPRLLKRIDEEYRKGRFKCKPVGPLGAYIKVKDPAWTPAIESYLGYGVLSGFAVDNGQDCKYLGTIMKEIFRGKGTPTIYASQFFDRVHDVSRMCVRHPKHKNMFEMMEISEPVVANCLIDQREVECCLLIPTSSEAGAMLSDGRQVPQNCRRGLTLEADEFYPDPQYRSYGGKVGRPRFLQVSTKQAILTLEEELGVAEEEYKSVLQEHRKMQEKLKRCLDQLTDVSGQVGKLRTMQLKKKTEIDRLADQLELEKPADYAGVFIEEMALNEKKLAEQSELETRLRGEVEEVQKSLKEMEVEVKRLQESREARNGKLNKIKDEIGNLKDEREMLSLRNKHITRKLTEVRQALQKATADGEVQKRVTDRAVAQAEQQCPRMDTKRTVAEIKKASSELRAKIRAVEQKNGTKEEIEMELAAKREKYTRDIKLANGLKVFTDGHLVRLQQRISDYKELKKRIGFLVQEAFTNILKLRNYEGKMRISYKDETLDLEVTPHNTAKRTTNDARTLSGGERSYSTVAFILALWECTKLPFYFLDEFDVFMDKVNRRMIMDILLDHTREHPRSQYVFLTPLDTSITCVDDYVSIHQLAPPERGGDGNRN